MGWLPLMPLLTPNSPVRKDPVLPIYLDAESQEKDGAMTQENITELTESVMIEKKAAEEKMAISIAKFQSRQQKNYR